MLTAGGAGVLKKGLPSLGGAVVKRMQPLLKGEQREEMNIQISLVLPSFIPNSTSQCHTQPDIKQQDGSRE